MNYKIYCHLIPIFPYGPMSRTSLQSYISGYS
uniref:Uncharacterized protein n=1 Tax=Anguilla anguilla TaxID=7936 RepID=A0A0E9QCQ2_ANGAN